MDRKLLHDLKSPIHTIQGYASLIADSGELDARLRGFADSIVSSAALMNHFIENLRILASPEGEPLPGGDRAGSLDAIVRETANGLERTLGAKGCPLKVDGKSLLLAKGAGWVERLTAHLLIAALQTAASGAEVRLEACPENDMLVLTIRGAGISDADMGGSHAARARILESLGGRCTESADTLRIEAPLSRFS